MSSSPDRYLSTLILTDPPELVDATPEEDFEPLVADNSPDIQVKGLGSGPMMALKYRDTETD